MHFIHMASKTASAAMINLHMEDFPPNPVPGNTAPLNRSSPRLRNSKAGSCTAGTAMHCAIATITFIFVFSSEISGFQTTAPAGDLISLLHTTAAVQASQSAGVTIKPESCDQPCEDNGRIEARVTSFTTCKSK